MPTNKQSNDTDLDEVDLMDDSPEIDQFLDKMEEKDTEVKSEQTARRKIEDLQEEKRLRQQIDDDFPDIDMD